MKQRTNQSLCNNTH